MRIVVVYRYSQQFKTKEAEMGYAAKDYSHLIGMEGFSETLLKNHFTLYEGYVANTNRLLDTLAEMVREGKIGTPEYAELKRRTGFEFNGMRLHEYYFENLGGKEPINRSGKLGNKLVEDFGSIENWEADFRGTGSMRGIGWAILYQDNLTGKLMNQWINEHETGHLAGCISILVMDVFEHAFMIDYGLKRADYIATFFKNIKWGVVDGRLK
ncbi:superoxide dismutase, Fe-Mn family [Candidatus Hakubella thermalkaliphila]|uniref:superoxide dismutase n=2 Tax=Candidatus Hakubella thermalkaliphila TaxID=2754717 RepID=A0A6V8NF29_9ACTN|nr:superoxide dismutase, Fe-Mn family [Candidatus Hakubella thermalkaliphila]